jgi:hypothetical protein
MIVVRPRRKWLVGTLLLSLALVAAGTWFILRPPKHAIPPAALRVVGAVLLVIAAFVGGVALRALLRGSPTLLIERAGLVFGLGGPARKRIALETILRVRIVEVRTVFWQKTRFLCLDVTDEAFRAGSGLDAMSRKNTLLFGFPVGIAENLLDRSAQELLELIDRYRRNPELRLDLDGYQPVA